MPALTSLALGATALASGVSGALGSKSKSSSTSGLNLDPASQREIYGGQLLDQGSQQFQDFVNAGTTREDVQMGTQSQRDLASMLQQLSQSGGMPNSQDITNSNNLAFNLMAGQREGLNQQFNRQNIAYDKQAALRGLDANDPIFRAKQAQSQMNQFAQLNANQNSLAQQLAMQQPMQRLGFAQQRAGVLGGLATQALANRQALAAMGEGVMNTERQFRINTAERYGSQENQSGGGLGGFLNGAMGGIGSGMSMMPAFNQMFGSQTPKYNFTNADGMGGGITRS